MKWKTILGTVAAAVIGAAVILVGGLSATVAGALAGEYFGRWNGSAVS